MSVKTTIIRSASIVEIKTDKLGVPIDQLATSRETSQERLQGLTEEQAETDGFGLYPHGLDPELPFIGIMWWTNREFIHHMAEIALLRDLWAARRPLSF